MSWTQGQHNRMNQSPFIDPASEDRAPVPKPSTSATGYTKPAGQRTDYNNQRTPQYTRPQPSREVAATFTQEGLQTFSLIFSSAVEAAIAKSLPDIVDKAVERKMREFVQQISTELNAVATNLLERVVDDTARVLQQRLATVVTNIDMLNHTPQSVVADSQVPESSAVSADEVESSMIAHAPEATSAPDDSVQTTSAHSPVQTELLPLTAPEALEAQEQGRDVRATKRTNDEVESLVQALQGLGRPAKTEELRQLVPDIHWSSNPSVKMSNLLIKSKGRIGRVGRGMYEYRA